MNDLIFTLFEPKAMRFIGLRGTQYNRDYSEAKIILSNVQWFWEGGDNVIERNRAIIFKTSRQYDGRSLVEK